jgi:hypothetical protein
MEQPFHVRVFDLDHKAGSPTVGQYLNPEGMTLDQWLEAEGNNGYPLENMAELGATARMLRVVTRNRNPVRRPDVDPDVNPIVMGG